MPPATVSATTIIGVISAVFTAAAAVATFVAVVYAKRTVMEARAARAEGHEAHEAEMSAMQEARSAAAAQAGWLLGEMKAATEASAEQHRTESVERRVAFEHDLIVRRLGQLQRVAEVLSAVINAAREERAAPSERIADIQPGRGISATPIMALQAQLRMEVRVLKALRGPDLSEVIPRLERDDQAGGLERLWFDGLKALENISKMIEVYESFQPDSVWDRFHEESPSRDWPEGLLDGP